MNKVLIYRDYGCADLTTLNRELKEYFEPKGIELGFTDAQAIIEDNVLNKEVKAFFMPGGAGTPYRQKLEYKGNDKIYEYVKNGGVYFGICAGAYYACRKTEFEVDIPELKIVSECGLNLIEGRAIGTLYKELGINPYAKNAYSEAVTGVKTVDDGEVLASHYHGGPYFDLVKDDSQKVEAVYTGINGDLPAIVSRELGKGLVIVSGVHLETKGEALKRIVHDRMKDKDRALMVAENLISQEESRKALFLKMMNKVIDR